MEHLETILEHLEQILEHLEDLEHFLEHLEHILEHLEHRWMWLSLQRQCKVNTPWNKWHKLWSKIGTK